MYAWNFQRPRTLIGMTDFENRTKPPVSREVHHRHVTQAKKRFKPAPDEGLAVLVVEPDPVPDQFDMAPRIAVQLSGNHRHAHQAVDQVDRHVLVRIVRMLGAGQGGPPDPTTAGAA